MLKQNIRIIPRLDIKGPNLVKGIHLEGLRTIGKPEKFARYYYENGADELLYMDTVASLYGRNSLDDIIMKTSKEIFIPLTVGGGIRSVEDIKRVLNFGADKVALNTAAVRQPSLISQAAERFGSSTIVISIEAQRVSPEKYEVFVDNGREHTGLDAVAWAKQVAELGAGEIIITSIDKEGTGTGYDIDLTRSVADAVSIPVIAFGGAGKLTHIHKLITETNVTAASMASILHYNYIKHYALEGDFSREGNIDFLKERREFKIIEDASLADIKESLQAQGIACRIEEGWDHACR